MANPPNVAEAPPSTRANKALTAVPSAWRLSVGAGAAAQTAVAPWWMAGGELHGSAWHRTGWEAGLSIAAFPESKGITQRAMVGFGLWVVRGEGCFAAIDRGAVRVLGCIAFEAGRLTASGEAGGPIATGVSESAAWLAGVAMARAVVPLGAVQLEAQGELFVPWSRDQFGIRTGPEFSSTHQPAALALGARLAVAYRFWE